MAEPPPPYTAAPSGDAPGYNDKGRIFIKFSYVSFYIRVEYEI